MPSPSASVRVPSTGLRTGRAWRSWPAPSASERARSSSPPGRARATSASSCAACRRRARVANLHHCSVFDRAGAGDYSPRMPIYEYRCEKCGDFEETQRITDPPLDRCPTCRRKVRRLISNTSFQLKGSGGYVNDYARAGKGSAKDKDAGSSDSSSSTESSAGTSDTTAKADSKTQEKSKGTKSAKKSETKAAAAGA